MSPRELMPFALVCVATWPGASPAGQTETAAAGGQWTSIGTNLYGCAIAGPASMNVPDITEKSAVIFIRSLLGTPVRLDVDRAVDVQIGPVRTIGCHRAVRSLC